MSYKPQPTEESAGRTVGKTVAHEELDILRQILQSLKSITFILASLSGERVDNSDPDGK